MLLLEAFTKLKPYTMKFSSKTLITQCLYIYQNIQISTLMSGLAHVSTHIYTSVIFFVSFANGMSKLNESLTVTLSMLISSK